MNDERGVLKWIISSEAVIAYGLYCCCAAAAAMDSEVADAGMTDADLEEADSGACGPYCCCAAAAETDSEDAGAAPNADKHTERLIHINIAFTGCRNTGILLYMQIPTPGRYKTLFKCVKIRL
jgi:hypothetical protein